MTNSPDTGAAPAPTGDMMRQWAHMSAAQIQTSPFFAWPPRPAAMVEWVRARWLAIGENLILVALAFATVAWFQPSLDEARTLAPGWIAEMYLRNAMLITVVAGGLHLYLHRYKKQGKRLKFDPREIAPKGRNFTFGGQVRDNMFWTLTSGVGFWTAYEALMFWAIANGYAPVLTWADNPVWFAAVFLLTPVWLSFHFYWIHRFLHWPPLYRMVHAVHHRNTNVGPRSGISMHPTEHLLFFSAVLIHWIVAASPVHIIFHMQHQALTGVTSHAGFEGLIVRDEKRLHLGNFHHQMHHRYFECNYGTMEMPWDKWFGSFHDGTDAAHTKIKDRRRRMGA